MLIVNCLLCTPQNENAADAMSKFKINACTDITGYGLLGHLKEMCEFSNVKAVLNFKDIPLLDNVTKFADQDIIPGGTKNNLKQYHVNFFNTFRGSIQ